jgi:hypothetical protein
MAAFAAIEHLTTGRLPIRFISWPLTSRSSARRDGSISRLPIHPTWFWRTGVAPHITEGVRIGIPFCPAAAPVDVYYIPELEARLRGLLWAWNGQPNHVMLAVKAMHHAWLRPSLARDIHGSGSALQSCG